LRLIGKKGRLKKDKPNAEEVLGAFAQKGEECYPDGKRKKTETSLCAEGHTKKSAGGDPSPKQLSGAWFKIVKGKEWGKSEYKWQEYEF